MKQKQYNHNERKREATIRAEVYEIWIVENGSLTEFGHGWPLKPTATANMCWGSYDTLDEVRERFRELADENYNRECGPCESADDPEAECAKYVADCVASLCIEWHDDLKWVRCRKMLADCDGSRTFVEVL